MGHIHDTHAHVPEGKDVMSYIEYLWRYWDIHLCNQFMTSNDINRCYWIWLLGYNHWLWMMNAVNDFHKNEVGVHQVASSPVVASTVVHSSQLGPSNEVWCHDPLDQCGVYHPEGEPARDDNPFGWLYSVMRFRHILMIFGFGYLMIFGYCLFEPICGRFWRFGLRNSCRQCKSITRTMTRSEVESGTCLLAAQTRCIHHQELCSGANNCFGLKKPWSFRQCWWFANAEGSLLNLSQPVG